MEEYLTNISISGFDFDKVFIFEQTEEDTTISQILFSTERGVELIQYSEGTYLKLND